MKKNRTLSKFTLKARNVFTTGGSERNLIKSLDKLDFDELLHVSQLGNEYVRGLKPKKAGVVKLDGLAERIYSVSVDNRQAADHILEHINRNIVRRNKRDVKTTSESKEKLLELMAM